MLAVKEDKDMVRNPPSSIWLPVVAGGTFNKLSQSLTTA